MCDVLFFLGVHEPAWVARTPVPLFVSARRLRRRKRLPAAAGTWALDSGGFTELSRYGTWRTDAMTYSTEVRRWSAGVGKMAWAAAQDWMCEPAILAKTGFTVAEHQRQTVANYLLLRQLAPDLPWLPVVQGWSIADYLRCVDLYGERGVDLRTLPLVGLGSVCRRQDTAEVAEIVHALHSLGLRLHGFGVKAGGLRRAGRWLVSADSMAWSFAARRSPPLPGCRHATCANCLRYALRWRAALLDSLPREYQARLPYRVTLEDL
ncbi:MAG: hypothetical protein IPM45_18265 [Acidimicrobiales bacterium]|nr:hypothetical protein [Acidimicrobiales bacterium]